MAMKRGLGKGLSSLIPDETLNSIQQAYIPDLPIGKIIPNQHQPRVEMNPDKLVELADSVREHGIIEPLIVTQNSPDEYELIAGERRWRASKLAGVKFVPVVIKDASPQQMLELAIVENIQREDLNPLEEALAFEHLMKKFGLTHNDIAQKVGYSRPAIANKIRLLQLPDEIKKGLLEEKLSEGHARALLGLKENETMQIAYKVIVRDSLSVRATEKLVQKLNQAPQDKRKIEKIQLSGKLLKIQQDFRNNLKANINLASNKSGGKIVIPFKDEKDLKRIHKKIFT